MIGAVLDFFWTIFREGFMGIVVSFVTVIAYHFRALGRDYKARWRSALNITAEVQEENERLLQERDEVLSLSQSLVSVIDEAEARWVLALPEEGRTDEALEEHKTMEATLTRAVTIVEASRRRQLQERETAREKERKRQMARRTPGQRVPDRYNAAAPFSGAYERYRRAARL
jgi:hypothetical protein